MSFEIRELDQRALEELTDLGGGERHVLSVYLAIDPEHLPEPHRRQAALAARLDEAERRLREDAGDGSGNGEALDSCLGRVRRALDDVPPPEHDAHALAVFCEDGGEMRAFWLMRKPDFAVAASLRGGPAIEPLVEALPGLRWAVALVSRKHGRIFTGSDLGLVEVSDVDDEVHRRHAQGGWSQGRFRRGIEKEELDHVGRVCDLLFELHRRRPFDGLIVAGPKEIRPLVDSRLHPYLRERLVGHAEVEVEHSTADQVLERAGGLMDEERARRERDAVEQVREGLGTGTESVAGLRDVLVALGEGRVGTLLIARGASEEVYERAVEDARAQSAQVVVVDGDQLDPHGRIAALLRY